ncbi:Potassium voltage-gated channel subfamily C member 2 [Phytophthora citrophthora]|uniref:Potassium voltage-gated channel subfamily C member 2 n=1 Tax=Phytophthora citrophthora TaxID=4793 RepID=A0AAD9GG67_9STRA|nr:Potassium voltage-gated channel subfamily C member 2 [Phytophthora citrophthora]
MVATSIPARCRDENAALTLKEHDVTDGRSDERQEEAKSVSPPRELVVKEVEKAEPLKQESPAPSNIPSTQLDNSRSKPQYSGQGRRRLYRRLRRIIRGFFTHDLPHLRSPEAIRAMPWRNRIHFYLSNPEESHTGWQLQQFLMLILFLNVGVMAAETVDGPRYGSSEPGYPYIPTDAFFNPVEVIFTLLYVVEFTVRCAVAPNQNQFWKAIPTWITFLAAIAALPRQADLAMGVSTAFSDKIMFNLRILRAIRLIVLAQAYVGTKVLFQAVKASIPPLTITLFFLLTVVMVFATAIFYAEPCYDLQTCTFTDILNTGYFVMLTVATVGYGNQVPSLHNAGSLFLVCIVMIFGTIYFSMPLAIIGIKYELAWTEYDEYAKTLKVGQDNIPLRTTRQPSKLSNETSRRQLLNMTVDTGHDETLERIDAYTIKYASSLTCDRFYQLSQGILQVNFALQWIISPTENASELPTTLEAVIQRTKKRSDEASQALDGIMSVIKLHSRICVEAHDLLSALKGPEMHETELDRFMSSSRMSKTFHTAGSHSVSKMRRAKGAIASIGSRAVKAISRHDYHLDPKSLRAAIWNTFEYRNETQTAHIINRARMLVIVLSIGVFYLQTTPELQKTGLQTFLCERTVQEFCAKYDVPGCYVFKQKTGSSSSNISVEVTDQRVDFTCDIGDPNESCFASGVNFGSDRFPLSCSDVFSLTTGVEHVCHNRLCNPRVQFIFDMEPYWIYLEFFFGIWFTAELALRMYCHPVRRHLWGDTKTLANIVILIPFYVELVEIGMGVWPTYAVVPTMPSFFMVVRFLKCLRILKLGSHIPGSRVLIRTAQLITERLAIPLFFLFLGCVVSAAVFFELERGTECFVGSSCIWWHKNVLTTEMSEGLPPGKRVLVQNTLLTIITDMLRSTWLSLVSFTTVGYGDLYPRTSLGKLVDIVGMIFSSCYTAMPLTLVGGQFYVCYELHAQEKRLAKERTQKRIAPDESDTAAAMTLSLKQAFPSIRERNDEASSEQIPDTTRTTSGPTIDPVNTFTSLPELSDHSTPSPPTVREERRHTQQYTHTTEVQIIDNFFLMQKVFSESIKDISLLTRLGVERVNAMRKNPSNTAGLTGVREREEGIETKVSENMDFCLTACLNFAAMIERILGTKRTKGKGKRPSTIQANALFAVADLTSELLQSNLSKVSTRSKKSIGRAEVDSSYANTRAAMKRVATLSKIFVGPNLQAPKPQTRTPKWAEFTHKKGQEDDTDEE